MQKSLHSSYSGEENGNALHRAYALINGERQEDYGKPWDNFGLLAEFFTSYTKKRWGVDIEFKRTDVVNFLMLLKLSRACVAEPTEDTYVDIAGYAGLGADFVETQRVLTTRPMTKAQAMAMKKQEAGIMLDGVIMPESVLMNPRVTKGSHDDWNTEDDLHG